MRYVLLLALLATPLAAQTYNLRTTDTEPDQAALQAQILDRDLVYFDDGVSRYNTDGTYAWTYSQANGGGVWEGTHVITDNMACVTFTTGVERCDVFVVSNGRLTLLTDDGNRYPVREIR